MLPPLHGPPGHNSSPSTARSKHRAAGKGRVSAQSKASYRVRSERKQHHEAKDVPRESGSPAGVPSVLSVASPVDRGCGRGSSLTGISESMDYVVLARKLRPQRFQDLVGQELAARALRNAIRTGHLAHAFLFAGSRGVGKTSTARILTKAFNCLNPQDGEPCNACENCTEISANASPDVYEIDAASNRGIDNIRELRENTKYAPAKCAYKTYIIDEVHMLTQESFNALLKTLEEPPPHVKFILATTHPHRIPETILSRCQRFDFARIPLGKMVDYLEKATAAEGMTFTRTALQSIARNSAGGMRDALTAVDQVVSFAGKQPTDEDVLGLLSLLNQGEVQALLDAILSQSLDSALACFQRIVTQGHELHSVLEALLREVKDLTLYSALGRDNAYFADHLVETLDFYEERKASATADQLQQVFQVLLELEGQLRSSGHARACFEMALVKACRVQPLVGVPELLARARELLRGTPGPAAGRPEGVQRPPLPRPRQPAATPPSASLASPRPVVRTAPPKPQPPARAPAPAREADPDDDPEPERQSGANSAEVADGNGGTGQSEASQPEPAPPEDSPDDGDHPTQTAPCDDPRWAALIQAVGSKAKLLAARLRDADVKRIEGDVVEATLRGKPLLAADQKTLETEGKTAFGAAFRVVWIDATSQGYVARRSVSGRKQWRDEFAKAEERAAAEADPAVQQARRFFPNSKIVDVKLIGTAAAGSPKESA